MDSKLPKKLSTYEPCKESTVEFRFETDIPSDAIIGIVFGKLKDRYQGPKELPIMQLPKNIRDNDINLLYAPHYIMENEIYQINIGPKVFAIISKMPYIGWRDYSTEIGKILGTLDESDLFREITRVGVRYINFFESSHDILNPKNINLSIETPFDENNSNSTYTTLIKFENFSNLLKIQTDCSIIMQNKNFNGSIVDIDTFQNYENKKFDLTEMLDKVTEAHNVEKKIFFKLLTKNFIDEILGAEYAE